MISRVLLLSQRRIRHVYVYRVASPSYRVASPSPRGVRYTAWYVRCTVRTVYLVVRVAWCTEIGHQYVIRWKATVPPTTIYVRVRFLYPLKFVAIPPERPPTAIYVGAFYTR